MSNSKLVSIIVPVYNAEIYLEKCLNSILDQTYTDFEVILIDDGSVDNSKNICKSYEKKDKRFFYYYQNNAGPSAARNHGILVSKGEFIQFMDSDDYLTVDAVELLVQGILDVELVIAPYYNLSQSGKNDKGNLIKSKHHGMYSKTNLLHFWGELVKEEVFHFTWNKLYRSEIIKEKIKFNENIKISEDMLFNIDYLSQIRTINIINKPVYYHILYNQSSLTKKYHLGLFEMRKKTHVSIEDFLSKYNQYTNKNKEVVNRLYVRRINSIFALLSSSSTSNISKKEKILLIETIINDNTVKEVLDYFDYSLMSKITGLLIKNKCYSMIYLLYFIREFVGNIGKI